MKLVCQYFIIIIMKQLREQSGHMQYNICEKTSCMWDTHYSFNGGKKFHIRACFCYYSYSLSYYLSYSLCAHKYFHLLAWNFCTGMWNWNFFTKFSKIQVLTQFYLNFIKLIWIFTPPGFLHYYQHLMPHVLSLSFSICTKARAESNIFSVYISWCGSEQKKTTRRLKIVFASIFQ